MFYFKAAVCNCKTKQLFTRSNENVRENVTGYKARVLKVVATVLVCGCQGVDRRLLSCSRWFLTGQGQKTSFNNSHWDFFTPFGICCAKIRQKLQCLKSFKLNYIDTFFFFVFTFSFYYSVFIYLFPSFSLFHFSFLIFILFKINYIMIFFFLFFSL